MRFSAGGNRDPQPINNAARGRTSQPRLKSHSWTRICRHAPTRQATGRGTRAYGPADITNVHTHAHTHRQSTLCTSAGPHIARTRTFFLAISWSNLNISSKFIGLRTNGGGPVDDRLANDSDRPGNADLLEGSAGDTGSELNLQHETGGAGRGVLGVKRRDGLRQRMVYWKTPRRPQGTFRQSTPPPKRVRTAAGTTHSHAFNPPIIRPSEICQR